MKQQNEETQDQSIAQELTQIGSLLHSESFAQTMAQTLDAAYYKGIGKTPPPFLSKQDEADTVTISRKDEKIATNLAGFYALECGLDYLAATQHKRPSDILKSILDDTISPSDKQLLCRFANATWKAGQPFRGLDRITRDIFTPFHFLTEADIEKDWVQIKAAAQKMLEQLSGIPSIS